MLLDGDLQKIQDHVLPIILDQNDMSNAENISSTQTGKFEKDVSYLLPPLLSIKDAGNLQW